MHHHRNQSSHTRTYSSPPITAAVSHKSLLLNGCTRTSYTFSSPCGWNAMSCTTPTHERRQHAGRGARQTRRRKLTSSAPASSQIVQHPPPNSLSFGNKQAETRSVRIHHPKKNTPCMRHHPKKLSPNAPREHWTAKAPP